MKSLSSDENTQSSTSSSSSSSESESDTENRKKKGKKKGKKHSKKKRGSDITQKSTSAEIKCKCKWSHVLLNKMMLWGTELKFNDLSFNQLVGGELEIIMKKTMKQREKETRLHILKKLAYLAESTSSDKLRLLYSAFMTALERGEIEWGNTKELDFMETTVLYRLDKTTKMKSKVSKNCESQGVSEQATPTFWCKEFNKGNCKLHICQLC